MRKSTVRITLALIGCIALAGCGKDEKRPVYKSRQDCLDDWGGNEKDCEQARTGVHSGYYYGPRYYGSLPSGRGVRSVSTATVSRGGFGSLASFHGGGS